MSLLILIHRTKAEDVTETSRRLFEKLEEQYCEQLSSVRHIGWFIDIGSDITIMFRSGENPAKVAGLRPDYYYSDDVMVREWIAQGAAKVGGKEIRDVDQVLSIISSYMGFKKSVDEGLSVETYESEE